MNINHINRSRLKNMCSESFAIHALEALGEDLYMRLTHHGEIIDPSRRFTTEVLFIDEFGALHSACFEYPCHMVAMDNWERGLINLFCAQTEGCEMVVGAISRLRDRRWHEEYLKKYIFMS